MELISLYTTQLYLALFCTAPLYCTSFYSILHCSTLPHSTLLCSHTDNAIKGRNLDRLRSHSLPPKDLGSALSRPFARCNYPTGPFGDSRGTEGCVRPSALTGCGEEEAEGSVDNGNENENENSYLQRGKSCPIPHSPSPRGARPFPFGKSSSRDLCGIAMGSHCRTVLTPSSNPAHIPVNDDTLNQALSVHGGRLLIEELEKAVTQLVEKMRSEKYK